MRCSATRGDNSLAIPKYFQQLKRKEQGAKSDRGRQVLPKELSSTYARSDTGILALNAHERLVSISAGCEAVQQNVYSTDKSVSDVGDVNLGRASSRRPT
jgi:hypothetical protein